MFIFCNIAGETVNPVDISSHHRRVPRIALFAPDGRRDLLDGFPGRFLTEVCDAPDDLEARLIGTPFDLVVLDCRRTMAERRFVELLRREHLTECLAVGRPPGRRSTPSWMSSHWCPWPVDRRSFYRLVVALARKSMVQREVWRLEHEVRDMADEANMGRRLAQVLHELGNPLDATQRFVRLARDQTPDAETGRFLEDALLGLRRMARVLAELRQDARAASQRIGRVPARDLVREALLLSGVLESGIEVRTRIEPPDCRVPAALGSAWIALLVNAKEATGGRGHIRIDIAADDGVLVTSISDDGEGFGDLFKDQMFQPYFTTKGHAGGLGIGLSGARSTVEAMGGRIEAASEGLGRGATFRITIPLGERTAAPAKEDPAR